MTKEGIWPISRVYKTWVQYDPLDYKRGFDATMMALKVRGHRIVSDDRGSGTVSAEMVSGDQDQKTHPVDIRLTKEKTSLTVHLSSKSSGGQENFCGFFEEFEKSIKRVSPSPAPKQTLLPSKKPVEPEKISAPPSPPRVETPKLSPPPTPSAPAPPAKVLPQTQVVWTFVNLREGPGTKHKIVGKAQKGTLLNILEEKEEWLHIRLEDGKEAWVSKKATSEEPKDSPSPSTPKSASKPTPPSPSPSVEPDSSKPRSPM